MFRSISLDENTDLENLLGPESHFLFDVLGVDNEWLEDDVGKWERYAGYQKAKRFVQTVKVANDAAERGIRGNSQCATVITDSPEEKHRLFQMVERHTHLFSDFSKKSLSKEFFKEKK